MNRWEGDGQLPQTRSEWVDEKLRTEILSGALRPGERLIAAELAKRWNVSPTPLREAFQRLAVSGLVELVPQRGARVAHVSDRDIAEVYELRELLEPLALQRSLRRATPSWRQEVRTALDRLVDVLESENGDVALLEQRHSAFHNALINRCDSEWLMRLVGMLAEHSIRYRLLSITPRGGFAVVKAEHEAVYAAVVEGDEESAVRRLTDHLRLTVRSLAEQRIVEPGGESQLTSLKGSADHHLF